MDTYRPPTNPKTGKPLSKKMQQGHAIQAVINGGGWVTAAEILERVGPLALDIDKARVLSHLDFELNKRKRLRKNTQGQYMLLGDPPNWRTANPDGTPKI